jgi:hypothetical protein
MALIAQQPLRGVGVGEFNFAWTLTPFGDRPEALFDHSHNLALQIFVELGVPLGAVVLALLLWPLARVMWHAWGSRQGADASARAAAFMLLLVGAHSLVEYPLWYAYFLLPTAWILGYLLGRCCPAGTAKAAATAAARAGGLAMVCLAVWALLQYRDVIHLFETRPTVPLAERLRRVEADPLYAYYADEVAIAANRAHPAHAWPAFRRPIHVLLHPSLLSAWADAFAERGDLDTARFLANRLAEFHRDDAKEYFAVCDRGGVPASQAYQCQAPTKAMSWKQIRLRSFSR